MRILRGGVQRVGASGGIVFAQCCARFDGVRNEAIVDDVQAHGAGSLLERCFGGGLVAKFPVVALVVGSGLVDLIGGVGAGQIHHRRQFLEIRLQRFGAVPRGFQGLADHDRVGFADVVDVLYRQRRVRWLHHVRAILGFHQPAAGQVADAMRLQIRAGQYRHHAGDGFGGAAVDVEDPGAGMRRAGEDGVALAIRVDVVGVASGAGDEAGVFLALCRSANAVFRCHFLSPWPLGLLP